MDAQRHGQACRCCPNCGRFVVVGTIASAILTTVLSFAADWLKGWYQAERAEADRWAARTKEGQMESLKRALADSRAIAAAANATMPPDDAIQWNARTVAAPCLLASLLALPGCFERVVYVPAARPIIDAPVRPSVPVAPKQWTERERILAGYAAALEAAVVEYNKRARAENTRNGY